MSAGGTNPVAYAQGFYGMGADPVAYAQGFYGTGAPRPNKSPRRKPGDREPQGEDPVA